MYAVLSQPGRTSLPGHALPLLFALGVWLVLQVAAIATGISPVAHGLLIDTDSYMKLVRIENLLATGDWFDGHIARSNAPFGETLHWTRLFDAIVIFGAGLLRPFMDLHEAVFWSGAAVSPLLNLGLIFAMIWSARPLLATPSREALTIAAVLTVAQPAIFSYSLPGRADHHVLLMVLFVLLFGTTMRALRTGSDDGRAALRYALAGGAIAGIGVWGSVELLITAAVAGVALGLAWVLQGQRWLRVNLAYAASFFLSTAAALAIERPWPDLLAVEGDRISVMQLGAAAALLAVWVLVAAAARYLTSFAGPARRLSGAGAAAAAAAVALLAAFPNNLLDPIGAVDPAIRAIWLDKVVEMHPLWPRTGEGAIVLLKLLGIGIAALPFLAWLLATERRDPAFLARLALALGLLAMIPVAFAHQRFSPYAEILMGMALAEFLRRAFERAGAQEKPVSRALWRVLPAVAVFLGPLLIGAKLDPRSNLAEGASPAAPTCAVKEMAPLLTAPGSEWSLRPQTILATIDLGPELLYRTPHRVIGSPYHRNLAGIRDSYAGLALGEEDARRVVAARRVDLILLCPKIDEAFFAGPRGEASLYQRLLRGDVPNWLSQVPLPGDMTAQFKLFRVVRP